MSRSSRRSGKTKPRPVRWAAKPAWLLDDSGEKAGFFSRLMSDLMLLFQSGVDRSAAEANWKAGEKGGGMDQRLAEWWSASGGHFARRKGKAERERAEEANRLHRQTGRRAYRW